nr:hypothetical protein [Tanacetum cinerariifolium]
RFHSYIHGGIQSVEGLSDIGSSGVEGPPMMPEDPYAYVLAGFQAPPSPDYVPGPKEPKQAPPLLEFVLELIYLKFMPLEDEILPAEEQPLPAADLHTVDSLGYIPESDPEEDPADYPTDEGDDDDDESSNDDEDDDDDVEEEEEEHPAHANSIPPPPVHRTTARIYISVHAPTPVWSEAEINRLLAIPSPPPSLLSQCPTYPLGYRAAMIWLRAETPSTSYPLPTSIPLSGTPPLLPIPLPTSSPPLLLPSTSHRSDVPEVTLPPRKRLCIALGAPATDETELRRMMIDFVTTVRLDTDEIYKRLDDAQDDRAWVQFMDASDTARAEVVSLCTTVLAQESEIAGLWAKIVPKRTTRSTPATTTTTTTTVTDAQLKALIDQGIANALAARDADRSRNGKDSHDSRMGVRR